MKRYLFLALLACATAPAAAEDFNYNIVSASYGQIDFDDINVDGDFFDVGLSLAIQPNFHVFGSYTDADLDFNVDGSAWSFGVGYNTPISPVMDVVAQLSYESTEVNAFGDTFDDDGFGLGVGLRAAVSEAVELNAGIQYVDLDSDSNTSFGVAAFFDLTDNFAIGLKGDWDDDTSAYAITGRFYFDR